MAEQFGPIGVAVGDGVATVTVDQPPVNAMGREVLAGLGGAAERVGSAPEVRAVVLTGTGQAAFMAGADIGEFQALRAEPGAMDRHSQLARAVFDAWQALPQPVIAAVQASAVGGGLEIALLCDLIVADPAARFGLPEVKLGLIPGGGGTQRLPARIGIAAAKELLFLGSLIDAPRAQALGLVNKVSEPGGALAEAQAIADRIAALPRVAVTGAKRAVNGAVPAAALDREREIFLEAFSSEDFTEGFAAFLEKRKPVFTHR
ncbi:MAG TPA: enoyl-CoA hydratase-related protein [Streptosporangiaceae bacterium]|nr:enoyl-CoA hydratase-related protein [Streptosporangiaceae bacterium]